MKWFASEMLGTYLLVFFGTGSVATAVAIGAPVGLFQVAIVWGLGLAVAIYLTAHHSGAHLNPAITLAFAVFGGLPWRRVPGYIGAQFIGAFIAAATVFIVFGGAIETFEKNNGIVRGQPGSEASAMMFGEYFPNPCGKPLTEKTRAVVPHGSACFAEFLGTALLSLAIFGFIAKENESGPGFLTPFAIGITLTVLICLFAPCTQAGFNPARDLAPHAFSAIAGWGSVPFSTNGMGWFTVYVVAPIPGALLGAFVATRLFRSDKSAA